MTNRRKFLVQTGMAATAILAAKPFNTFAKASGSFSFNNNSLVLLHSNGFHLESGIGLLQKTIADAKAGFNNVILLDTGSHSATDAEQAANLSKRLQQLGFDAGLPGNVHFESSIYGQTVPMVVSNSNRESMGNNIQPYHIIKKGIYKIGIIGAHAGNSGSAEQINALAEKLKTSEGCHIVVCLSGLGYKTADTMNDIDLAGRSTHIDVIIGTSGTRSNKPELHMNANRHEVLVNHTSGDGVMIGRIEIGFDENQIKNRMSFANLYMEDNSAKCDKFKV